MLNIRSLNLQKEEKRTFKLHTAHMFLEGIIDGALLLNEFILIKSLMGSDYQISYLFQFSVVILIFSVLFNEIVKRTRNKKRLLRMVALVSRLPLVALAFFPNTKQAFIDNPAYPSIFLSIFLFYYLYKPVILPTINLLLRSNYTKENFGKLYSYSTSLKKIVVLFVTFGFGVLLGIDNYAFTYVYPILSILGILSIFLLSLINFDDASYKAPTDSLWNGLKQVYQKMINIVIRNKPYRDFEIGFMFYGFAWMATAAVITIFMNDYLQLSYPSVAFYKNAYHLLAILLLPFFGKLIGRIDPRKFGVYTFATLLFHLLFMLLAEYYPKQYHILGIQFNWMLIISFVFYGLFTATMALLWGIGSSYFCKDEDAGDYQSVHLTLVGTRGLFAPVLGVYFFNIVGYTGTFAIGIFSLLISIFLMFYSMKKYRI